MTRNKLAFLCGIGLSITCLTSQASDGFYDKARVVKVKPMYERVEVIRPETRCWNETVYHSPRHESHRSYTPTIAGAIVGGVVGNQFSDGGRRDALTVAGALLGASIGNDISHHHRRGHHRRGHGYRSTERRCETIEQVEEEQELIGYRVKYRYKGQTGWINTKHDPGEYIQVRVSVEPAQKYNF